MTVMNLDQLEVWVKAHNFAVTIYKPIVPRLSASEKYNLVDQLKRAASSVPANIAEGHGHFYFQDNVRFCYIARGSLTDKRAKTRANEPGASRTVREEQSPYVLEDYIEHN